jgi:hypothetical protein
MAGVCRKGQKSRLIRWVNQTKFLHAVSIRAYPVLGAEGFQNCFYADFCVFEGA